MKSVFKKKKRKAQLLFIYFFSYPFVKSYSTCKLETVEEQKKIDEALLFQLSNSGGFFL